MSVVIESTVRKIGERLVEEGRRRDRGERELVERLRLLEEEIFSRERARINYERTREERIQELERRLKDVGIEEGKKEERIQELEKKAAEGKERERTTNTTVAGLIEKVEALTKGKESLEEMESRWRQERLEKERTADKRMLVVEEGLQGLHEIVKGKGATEQCANKAERTGEIGKQAAENVPEKDGSVVGKMRKIEESLERERRERTKWEEERREEKQMMERKE
jgi:hypothetical protein